MYLTAYRQIENIAGAGRIADSAGNPGAICFEFEIFALLVPENLQQGCASWRIYGAPRQRHSWIQTEKVKRSQSVGWPFGIALDAPRNGAFGGISGEFEHAT